MSFQALLAVTFLASAAGLVVEIVAGRMMAPFFGMSVQTWTVVISVVLLGFSLGHAFGGCVADMERRKAWTVTGTAFLLASASTALAESLLVLAASDPGTASFLAMAGAAGLAFFVPSFCVSFPTPFITKAAVESGNGVSGRALGLVYGASSFGAIAGSVSAGFWLVPVIGSSATMTLVAAVYLAIGAAAYRAAGELRRRAGAAGAVAAAVIMSLHGGGFMSGYCEVESSYYCIRHDVVEAEGIRMRRMIINQGVHSAIDLDDPARQPLAYAEQAVRSLLEFAVRRPSNEGFILFIGGGGYSIPAAVAEALPEWRIEVAEIDPAVTAFVEEWFPEVQIESFRIRHADGRLVLASAEDSSLDIVMLDAFSDIAVPEHLVTAEFMALASRKLKPDGLLLANVIDREDDPRFLASLAKTARKALPEMAVFRDHEDRDGNGFSNYLVAFARDRGNLPQDGTDRMVRFDLEKSSDVDGAAVQTDDRSDAGFLVRR